MFRDSTYNGFLSISRYSHDDNIVFNDVAAEEAVTDSVKEFKAAGGGCLVENSTKGLHRKSSFLKDLSKATGVNIVAGTGMYKIKKSWK